MRELIPINKSAIERNADLQIWLESWLDSKAIFLTPEQWFLEAHDIRFDNSTPPPRKMCYEHGTHVWSPPPAVGDVVLEQLRHARLKRQ